MRLAFVLALPLLGACSRPGAADLPAIAAMRSAAAEWALVNREAQRGRVTPAYAEGMRAAARAAIASEARGLRDSAAAAREAAALQALPADAAPAQIARHAAALERIEKAL